jgi:hypothetical protein
MSRPGKYPEELVNRGIGLAFQSGRPIAHVAAASECTRNPA